MSATKHKIVHVIQFVHQCWDLTEKKWVMWPKFAGRTSRYLHSARKARIDFEKILRQPPCFRQGRWLVYKNGRLARVKSVGWMERYPIRETLEVNHMCLNPIGLWCKILTGIPFRS